MVAAAGMAVLCGYAAFTADRRKRVWAALTAVSVLLAAIAASAARVGLPDSWRFDEYVNALHMAAAWQPLCIAGAALFSYFAYTAVLRTAPFGKFFWVACATLCGVGLFFGLTGMADHPVTRFLAADTIAWLIAVIGAGVILTAEFTKADPSTEEHAAAARLFRRAVFGDALWISATAALVGWAGQLFSIGLFSVTSPVFMFSAGLAGIALHGYLGENDKRFPFAFVYLTAWAFAWGYILEYV
jgi:hypothetical protein